MCVQYCATVCLRNGFNAQSDYVEQLHEVVVQICRNCTTLALFGRRNLRDHELELLGTLPKLPLERRVGFTQHGVRDLERGDARFRHTAEANAARSGKSRGIDNSFA